MNPLQLKIHPGLRGASFYAAFWGVAGMIDPFMNVYFIRLGITATQIGWLAAILPFCTMLIAPLIARLADRFNRRVIFLVAACLGFGAALILPALPIFQPTFAGLIGFVALFSIFRSPIVALADSLIAQMALRHSLDFGSMRLWGSIVFTATAILFGWLWQQTGFTTMFLVSGLSFLLVIGAAMLLEETPHITHPSEKVAESPQAGRFAFDPGLFFLLCSTFLIVASLMMAGTFGVVYMNQIGGSEMMVGALMGIAALGEVPGMLYGSRLARQIGVTNTLITGYGLIAVGMAATGLVKIPWLMLVFAMVRGLGYGFLLVSTVMIINTRAPKNFTSTYQGILNAACWGLAPLLGGPISGWIFQNLGPAILFFTTAGMCLSAAVLITPTYRLWAAPVPAEPAHPPVIEQAKG